MQTSIVRGLAILLVSLAALGALRAEPAGGQRFTVTPAAISGINSVVASGGGLSSGGAFTLHGTIGQAAAGVSSAGAYTLTAGFWIDAGRQSSSSYLPLVRR